MKTNISRFILASVLGILLCTEASGGEEKVTIGPVEEVVLLPSGIKLRARIDTGANTTSLGARNLVIKAPQRNLTFAPG